MRYVLSGFSYPDKDHHVIGRPDPLIVEPAQVEAVPGAAVAGGALGAPVLATEQFGLGGGELVVGEGTLLMQRGELVQLIEHSRCGRSRSCRLLGRGCLLLFDAADALILLGPFSGALSSSLASDVRAAANHSCAQQRPPSHHHC
jgi:hypothetical protein